MAGIEQAPQRALVENEKSTQDTDAAVHEKGDLEQANRVDAGGSQPRNEAHLVIFAPGDTEDPKNWSKAMKWGVTLALSATGFNRIMISTVRIHFRTIRESLLTIPARR